MTRGSAYQVPSYYLSDDGCELAPACLSCPFPYCVRHEGPSIRELRARERDREIFERAAAGAGAAEIAEALAVSRRTVNRVLRGAEEA